MIEPNQIKTGQLKPGQSEAPNAPLDGQTLAAALGSVLTGENRSVTTLVAPPHPVAGAVMVVDSAAQLARLGHVPEVQLLGALVIPAGLEVAFSCPTITVAQPRVALAELSALFAPEPPQPSISEHALIDPGAVFAAGVSVGAGAVVGAGVSVGAGTRVGAGCVLGDGSSLGEGCVLHAHVTLYPGMNLGDRVIVHSGAVIGGDGFGYAFGAAGALKIEHLGTVVLENDVEIGANSCIDRGTLGETRVGARSKIDNLCQIGHNVVIGPDCLIAGSAAIGGSTVLERGVILGGAVAITDHVRLGAGARISGRSSVTKSVPAGEAWAGYPAKPQRKWVRELYLLGKLDGIWSRLKTEAGTQRD